MRPNKLESSFWFLTGHWTEGNVTKNEKLCSFLLLKVICLLPQAYAMMLSLSENNPLHGPSQNSLDAWLSMGGGPSETSSFHPLNHI